MFQIHLLFQRGHEDLLELDFVNFTIKELDILVDFPIN